MNRLELNSSRTAQARLAMTLGHSRVRTGLVFLYVLTLCMGLWLVMLQQPIGWILFGLSFWPILPLVWYEWWLKDLPPTKTANSVDDVLEASVLGRLPKNASPQQIAEVAMSTNGGLFFMVRLGVGPNFVREMSSSDPANSDAVWQAALDLQRQIGAPYLSAAAVTAALVSAMPGHEKLLATLQLTPEDITAAVSWYHHLKELIDQEAAHDSGGGIGRDLNFGYTNMLSRFSVNMSQRVGRGNLTREVDSHQAILDKILQQMLNAGSHSVVLVGPTGVGKTTLVEALAERLMRQGSKVPSALRYHQVLALDPSTIISQARGRGDVEELVTRLLNEAYGAKNVILFFDNAELFFSDDPGAVDIRNILLPVMEGGALDIVMAMDEHQWLKLSRATPTLAQRLNRITIKPLSEAETLMVCEDQILSNEFRSKVTYMYQALKTAYRLGARYVTDQAMPGQALHLLDAAAHYADRGLVTSASVEDAAEQMYGVKVSTARQGDERQTLLNLEQLLHARMINQSRAVSAVANALRRARTGVRNQNRPIGSFLFLGPTGVGKTELAKALAAVYFGGDNRLVRVDLNEFSNQGDVARLIADAATDPHSLTAQIAKQPFSVVLLDEIEKAHPSVQDTLLQLLDEGILRDINNREVSFRDAVVIATSNAGADQIRKYINAGAQPDQFEAQFVNQLIDSGLFKPELMNRFDEITVFRPLTELELLQVVDLLLAEVNKTLATQHVQVTVADDAKRELVRVGNDPRLGARPLRRVVQRTVENIVAKKLLQEQVAPGSTVMLSLQEVEEALSQ